MSAVNTETRQVTRRLGGVLQGSVGDTIQNLELAIHLNPNAWAGNRKIKRKNLTARPSYFTSDKGKSPQNAHSTTFLLCLESLNPDSPTFHRADPTLVDTFEKK